jgi:transposase-like protein
MRTKPRKRKIVRDNKPRCKGCNAEFKLLTAMGIKKVDMYCLSCEHVREKLGKQVKDWELMDKRIKERILPTVKGYSWMEQKRAG